jgi:hypothetical protein
MIFDDFFIQFLRPSEKCYFYEKKQTQDVHFGVRISPDPAENGIFPESFRPISLIFPQELAGNRRKVEGVS